VSGVATTPTVVLKSGLASLRTVVTMRVRGEESVPSITVMSVVRAVRMDAKAGLIATMLGWLHVVI
jgi:hypothetical protein